MKIFTSIAQLVAFLLFVSCNFLFDKNDEPKTELEKLPPISQTGENTFGCLVNGKAFVVSNTNYQVAIFQQGQLELSARNKETNMDRDINIILGDPLKVGKNYYFNMNSFYKVEYRFTSGYSDCHYEFEDTFSGSISFSKIDRLNYIISGTFEFSAVTTGCDTIRITDGRFDMQYIP